MKTGKNFRNQYMTRRLLLSVSLLMVVGLLSPGSALAHPPGVTTRVSVSSDGTEWNDASGISAISGDGRFVAFGSNATNLIPGGNLPFNIFVHDRQSGSTEIVSVSSSGRQG